MGIFTRKKVDGEVGTDAPIDDATTSGTTNGKTGTKRFGRTRKATDVSAPRTTTAGAISTKAMRLVQLLLAILILGLVAYAINIFQSTFVSECMDGQCMYRSTNKAL
jgi:hypothetical protein